MLSLPASSHTPGSPLLTGKWHVGMASLSSNPPETRGFDTSLGYFHSTNNYYDMTRAEGCDDFISTDLWDTGAPAVTLNGTIYEERLFGQRAVSVIEDHPAEEGNPLFLYYAFHTSCVGFNTSGDAGEPEMRMRPQMA